MQIHCQGHTPVIWVLESSELVRQNYRKMFAPYYNLRFFSTLCDYLRAHNADPTPALLIAELEIENSKATDLVKSLLKPCIIVSAVADVEILRLCFASGVKDYLTKPFARNELIVKVENTIYGRGAFTRALAERNLPFRIDATNLTLQTGTRVVKLTPREMQILAVFLRQSDFQSREKIIAAVWKDDAVSAKALDVHLFNLRRKLNKLGGEILHKKPNQYNLVVA